MSIALRSSVALVFLLAAATSSAHAGWLGFRNQLTHAVLIESTRQVKNTIHTTAPQFLYPGETLWHRTRDVNSRRITVLDARAGRPVLVRFEAQPENLYVIESKGEAGGAAIHARLVSTSKSKAPEATARKE